MMRKDTGTRRRLLRSVALVPALVCVLAATSSTSGADHESRHGHRAPVITSIGADDVANAVAIQPDRGENKTVVVGSSDGDMALARYHPDGSLDRTFGAHGNGVVTTAVGTGDDGAKAVAIDAIRRIVVAGYTHNGTNDDFAVARYDHDGRLDESFGGGDGVVTTAIGSDAVLSRAHGVALQGDKIVVVGGTCRMENPPHQQPAPVSEYVAVRYTAAGDLDVTEAGEQWLVTALAGRPVPPCKDTYFLSGVAIHDHRIVAVGSKPSASTKHIAVVAFASGALDPSFAGGVVTTPIGALSAATGVAIRPDGTAVVSGFAQRPGASRDSDFALVRLGPGGNLIGSGVTDLASPTDVANGVTLQTDGKVLLAGTSAGAFASVRYDAAGLLDPTFEGDGTAITSLGEPASAQAVAVNGCDVVVAGSTGTVGQRDFALVRYSGCPGSPLLSPSPVATPISPTQPVAAASKPGPPMQQPAPPGGTGGAPAPTAAANAGPAPSLGSAPAPSAAASVPGAQAPSSSLVAVGVATPNPPAVSGVPTRARQPSPAPTGASGSVPTQWLPQGAPDQVPPGYAMLRRDPDLGVAGLGAAAVALLLGTIFCFRNDRRAALRWAAASSGATGSRPRVAS